MKEADRLFAAKGFEHTKIADIARALSISPALIFKHFGTKAQLAGKVVERRLLGHIDIVGETALERFENYLEAILGVFLELDRTEPRLSELVAVFLGCPETRDELSRQIARQAHFGLPSDELTTFDTAVADIFVATVHSSSVNGNPTLIRRRHQNYTRLLRAALSGL